MLGRPTASIDTPAMTRTSARHMAASTRRRWRDPRASAGGRDGSGGVAGRARSSVVVTGVLPVVGGRAPARAGGGAGREGTRSGRWAGARADVRTFLRRMAEDVSGAGAQTMLGFLASLRSDPEVADVYRETKIAQMHEHLRSRLAAELGDDFPDLDLRAAAGPAILIYQAA